MTRHQPPLITRREASLAVLGAGLAATGRAWAQAPAVHRPPELRWTTAVPVTDFCPPNASKPQGEALQAALNAAFETGLPLIFPRGDFTTDQMLTVTNPDRRMRGFPRLLGTATRLNATPFEGAVLRLRGAPAGPPGGSMFLTGGRIEGFEFHGQRGPQPQNGLDILGWHGGTVESCSFENFSGHGIRCYGDLGVDPNPDWTSSIVRLSGVVSKRNAGWGFLDDHPVGATLWAFERCIFHFNGAGGAWVRSQGNTFNGCAFAQNGFFGEDKAAPGIGYGLRVGDAARVTMNRLRVTVAEFDANKDAHIWIDRCLSFFVEDARFIHNDRDHRGSISPPVAVLLGSIHPESRVHNGRFSRPVFRLDTPGQVTGFRLQTANASGLAIETGFQTDALNTKGMFKAHDGFGPPAEWPAKNIVIDKV